MTPADGSFLVDMHLAKATTPIMVSETPATLVASVAVMLPGGRSLLAIRGTADIPPELLSGPTHLVANDCRSNWIVECWSADKGGGAVPGWAALALVEGALLQSAEIYDASGATRLRLSPAPRLDVSPGPVAEFVRSAGLNVRVAFDFLLRNLLGDRSGLPDGDRWLRDFAAGFVTAAADADGFIEVLAIPDGGGVFVQGWSMSLGPGRATLATLDGGLAFCNGDAAVFTRDDILPPGHGFCFFSPDWPERDLAKLDVVFLEEEGRLRRLDVVRGSILRLTGERATAHVAHMLPRLVGPKPALLTFRRVCRPRYAGVDTLSMTTLPVAAAFDAVFQAPDGGLLAMGWLLDPLARVERVLVKSTAHLYAPLQDSWNLLPRPDLHTGFAGDPRFVRLLDDGDAMHGFLAYAPGRMDQVEGAQVYLELVLDDNTCLFRPLAVTRLDSRDRLPQILSAVPPSDPGLDAIVENTLAPFLAGLPPRSRRARMGAARAMPLGDVKGVPKNPSSAARKVAAVMPFRTFAQLQPVMALLAGTAEAEALDLVLVTTRSVAASLGERLADAFRFYGLTGRLALTSDHEGFTGQVEAGIAASEGERILLWTPAALPMGLGWLARLTTEAAAMDRPGLLSPSLVYEDGSICFGSAAADEASTLLGYPAAWSSRGPVRPVPAGAAEVALIDRVALERAGGFAGLLFSDALAHRDLARRLQAAGCGTWGSGSVEFWMLGDETASSSGPHAKLMEKVDAALVAGRRTEAAAR